MSEEFGSSEAGKKGGEARAKNLSKEKRSEIAKQAAAARWAGDDARYYRRPGEVAIPTDDPGLADGVLLDCERFPLVWTATPR